MIDATLRLMLWLVQVMLAVLVIAICSGLALVQYVDN